MISLLFTCEHAVNFIPEKYSDILRIPGEILQSHKGYDRGALELCKFLSGVFVTRSAGFSGDLSVHAVECKFITGKCGRLLVDLNRSPKNKNLYSQYSKKLTADQKHDILEKYYYPYRNEVENFVTENVRMRKKVIHFSIHTFTPVLDGKTRNADIGLLYDPARTAEAKMADEMKNHFENFAENPGKDQKQKRPQNEEQKISNGFKIRKNYPYRGASDGMISYLRKKFFQPDYAGFELEFNQKIFDEARKYHDLKFRLPGIITAAMNFRIHKNQV